MKHAVAFAVAVLAAAFALSPGSGDAQSRRSIPATLDARDQRFIVAAAQSNAAEISQGKLAQRHATSATVREIAKHFVENHSANQEKLLVVGTRAGATLPSSIAPTYEARAELHRLADLPPADFDAAFLSSEEQAHRKTIAAFKDEIAHGKNKAVVEYAKQSLPVLEQHLSLASANAAVATPR